MDSDVDVDMFQDSFDAEMAQMPGENTMLMMNDFTLNSSTDLQASGSKKSEEKKKSPGFVTAKKLYADKIFKEQTVMCSKKSPQNPSVQKKEAKSGQQIVASVKQQVPEKTAKTDGSKLGILENKKIINKNQNENENKFQPPTNLCKKKQNPNINSKNVLNSKGLGRSIEKDKPQSISSDASSTKENIIGDKIDQKNSRDSSSSLTTKVLPCDLGSKKDKVDKESVSKLSKKLVGELPKNNIPKPPGKLTEKIPRHSSSVSKNTSPAPRGSKVTTAESPKKELPHATKNPPDILKTPQAQASKNVRPDVSEAEMAAACDLRRWGLPDTILQQYAEKGITSMFPWQVECLRSEGVMDGGNLVYSAPTSAGKTLVAEILMIKRVIESGKKALLILPFVALAREKMFHLQHVLGDTGIRVEGFMGSISPAGGIKVADIGVATIEKANGIVNRLLEEGELSSIGCVVVDELHLLGDPSRGYLLELLLTKIRYVSSSFDDREKSVQIIGMSATLPNLVDLSRWLAASLYTTTFRPVPLTELVKIGSTLLDTGLVPVGSVLPAVELQHDRENISWLCLETVMAGHSILIFCPIKSWVEKLAEAIAKDFFNVGRPDPTDRDEASCRVRSSIQKELDGFKLGEVLEQLKRCPSSLDQTLAATLRFGVGFHHAGLTTDERDILEGNFKSGVIRVLVATSTLSSGVNLPARRVILRCPMTYNGQLMDRLAYKQMVGRAGRKGVDSAGESILICKESEREKVRELVSGESEAVMSCLAGGGTRLAASMKRAILEVIVSGAATTRQEVERYASCTLLAAQIENTDQQNSILECVEFLEKNEFIRIQGGEGEDKHRYIASRLGLACLASSLAPDEGLTVFSELAKARKQFVLENELHIIYLIVPLYAAVSWPKLDWMAFLSMWEGLSEDKKRVGHIVGVEERWIVRAMRGTVRSKEASQLATHQRFYTALALHDLAHEVPLNTVANKYGATKGMLQSLQQAASTFAGMVTVFCARLGWCNLELLLGQFQDRLEFGVRRELIDLCRLTSVDGASARVIYDKGVESVAQLASTAPEDVENILYSAEPFKSKKDGENIRRVKTVFISGLPPMTEGAAARIMVEEARSVLRRDLGLQPGAWIQKEGSTGRAVPAISIKPPSSNEKKRKRSLSGGGRSSRSSRRLSGGSRSGLSGGSSRPGERGAEDEGLNKRRRTSLENVEDATPYDANDFPPTGFKTPCLGEPRSRSRSGSGGGRRSGSIGESPGASRARSTPSIIGDKSIFISPPAFLRKQNKKEPNLKSADGGINKQRDEDHPDKIDVDIEEPVGDVDDDVLEQNVHQFDMSSIIENIFEDELEMTSEMKSSEVKKQSSGAKKKKKVSWGSEDMVFIPEHVSASPRLKPSQMKGIEGKELTSTRGLNPKERAAGEVFEASSGFIQLEELTLQLSESDSDTDIKQTAEDEKDYGSSKPALEQSDSSKPLADKNGSKPSADQKGSSKLATDEIGSSTLESWAEEDIFDTSPQTFPPPAQNKKGIKRKDMAMSRGASEKWDTQFTFSAEPVDQNQHDNVKPQTHPEDKPQDLSVDKPLSVMKEQTNKPQKLIQPQQNINSCKLEEKAVNHKEGGETAENGEKAKEEVKNMADENISEDWSSAAFLSPNQTNQQPRGAFKSELGTPLTYSRTKKSLKDRKRNAKRSKKTASSPGDLILSGGESEPGTPPAKSPKYEFNKSAKPAKEIVCEDLSNISELKDVCSDRRIFNSFVQEFKSVDDFSFALAVEREKEKDITPGQGEARRGKKQRKSESELCRVEAGVVVGVGFCFKGLQAFYLALIDQDQGEVELDDTLTAPNLDQSITLEDKLKFLRWLVCCKLPSLAVAWRRQAGLLYSLTGRILGGAAGDPGVACWLLDPGAAAPTLNRLVLEHVPDLVPLLQHLGSAPGVGSVSCAGTSVQPARLRAVVESILVRHLHNKLYLDLVVQGLQQHYAEVEMGVEAVLLGVELTGMGVHTEEFRDTRLMLEQRCKIIEEESYRLAGRHFTFSSPQDVCRVLYHEMKFPVNGDPKLNLRMVRPGKGGIKLTAAKEPLEKLARTHQLPKLILEHRRISGALSRTLNPLLAACVHHTNQTIPRVFSTCITHTATGRVSMHEPNLQNIPNDFQVEVTDDLRQRALGRRSRRRGSNNRSLVLNHLDKLLEPTKPSSTISLRNAIIPCAGSVYVSADYSQLELRILAHLSQDAQLLATLTNGGDVFKALAARIQKVDEAAVTNEQRQQAKQVVYGLVYGVGARTLGDQLQVTELEAERFMDKFKAEYPGVRMFLNKCVATARRSGVVQTISGRKRSIPDISSANPHRRAAAERQAVNTRVQGSAADLVKTAMVLIEARLETRWSKRRPIKLPSCPTRAGEFSGPWLVLQLHDELIYEVLGEDAVELAEIVRDSMETAMALSVPLPVRVKIGDTWGSLQVFKVDASS